MANYNSIRATINANIKANNNQAITGVILNSVLNEIIDTLGAGYQFAGIVTTSTDPGTPDQRVFYLAGAGTYSYFGSPTVTPGNLGVFWYDSAWHTSMIDVAPVIDLVNNLSDGGVDKALTAEMGKFINEQPVIARNLYGINGAAYQINDAGNWGTADTYRHIMVRVHPGEKYIITAADALICTYAFMTSADATAGSAAAFVTGTTKMTIPAGTVGEVTIPETCNFLYFFAGSTTGGGSSRTYLPKKMEMYGDLHDVLYSAEESLREMEGIIPVEFNYGISKYVLVVSSHPNDHPGDLLEGNDRTYSEMINIQGKRKLIYSRPVSTAASPAWGMAFYDSSQQFISGQTALGGGDASGYERTEIDVPEGASYARFTKWSDPSFDFYLYDALATNVLLSLVADFYERGGMSMRRTISPLLTYDIVRSTTGDFSTNPNFSNLEQIATARFVKTSTPFSVKVGATCVMRVYFYDENFSYLGYSSSDYSLIPDTETEVTIDIPCTYVKMTFISSGGMPSTKLEMKGYFPEDWDTFNPRSSDSGYHRVSVMVNVTNPTCCDEESSTVQDSRTLLPDYGVICLPTQYRHNGEPTRLIIYCHGAAVNYSSSVTRFDAQDLDPTYWLAEGYAILDVEGNPFNNTDEHICIPQTMDCYVAAYKWAIEHYNLRRDGIFLGGRSMGGQNTFNLMRRECPIPVIAACPNSAAPDSSFGYGQAVRKAFCALHMGFILPQGFTWSDGDLTPAEAQVLSDNWDKYIKCCPELSACVDLPSKDVILPTYTDSALRLTVWGGLKMRAKCPVKLFGCNQDESCPPAYTTSLYYRMLMNSGQMAECRLFNSYKDYSGTGTSAHHYDTQDPALRTDITSTYGQALTNVPIVYIEMLEFWRRYEQGN